MRMNKNRQRFRDGIFSVVLLIAATALLYRQSLALGLVFTVLTVVFAVYLFVGDNEKFHWFRYHPKTVSGLFPNVLKNTDQPVAIVGEDNRIIWANRRFEALPETASHTVLPPMDKLFGGALAYPVLKDAVGRKTEPEPEIDLFVGNASYRVRIIPLSTKKNQFFGLSFTDASEELRLSRQLRDGSTVVMLAMVDNISELSQRTDEAYRRVFTEIEQTLSDWANSIDSLFIEYERGKFLLISDRLHLDEIKARNFPILEAVSALSADQFSSPLTISVGVSEETGTLGEKLTSAQNAIRAAFQKGGAIAMVRENGEYLKFGGGTKSVQKQTSIRSRICRDLLIGNIRTSSNVLILGHVRPDFDCIGSNVGIARLAMYLGKPVNIVIDAKEGNIASAFSLLAELPEYRTMFVDPRRGMDLVTPDTLLIVTDVSNPRQFYAPDICQSVRRVILIDHHSQEGTLGSNVLQPAYIDPNASSASELVSEILELAVPDGTLHSEEAQLLLSGIMLDTDFFARDTGSRTFRSCSYLQTAGADPAAVKRLFRSNLHDFERTYRFLQNKYLFSDRFMITYYDEDTDPRNMAAAAIAANRLLEIDGVSATFSLYKLESGISLSARSDGTFNVIKIVGEFGGGGHFQSAGARILSDGNPVFDMDEARRLLEQAITKNSDNSERR